jgi:MinD-like ATPase involved in chromosome partitioning or flagellar assembly
VAEPRPVTALLAEREVAQPPRASSGLDVVDGAGWEHDLARGDLARLLERLGHEHTFHLLDAGDDWGEGAHAAIARADQVVLVGGAGEAGAAGARLALERIEYANPYAAGRVVQVLLCQTDAAWRETRRDLPARGASYVVVPPDPNLQSGAAFDPARLVSATREAFLRVAAAVAGGPAAGATG